MIGKHGISLSDYRDFLQFAEKKLKVRRGGLDCTMYGGECGAGNNNYFFANGNVYFVEIALIYLQLEAVICHLKNWKIYL